MTQQTTTAQSALPQKSTGSEHQSNPVQNGKPLRVLFVNDHLGFADGVIHGPARYLFNVLPRLDSQRVSPSICILRNWHPFASEMEKVGISPIFLNRTKWDPRVVMDLVRLIKTHKIDILHLMGMKGCLLGRIAGRMTGIPCIIHIRDINPMGKLIRFMQRGMVGWTDRALAVSNPVRSFTIDQLGLPEDRVEVLYNPIDTTNFAKVGMQDRAQTLRELGIFEKAQVCGIVARMSPEKDHRTLIQVMPKLLQRFPNAVLCVVGDGPTRAECERLTKRLNIQRAVRFLGYRQDIPKIVAAMDIMMMTSIREGFPNAALEASAAGKPVVAFRVGGLPEIVIHGETGFLVAPNAWDDLIDKVGQLFKDPDLRKRQGEAGRRYVQRFNMAQHLNSLENIYAGLARPSEKK